MIGNLNKIRRNIGPAFRLFRIKRRYTQEELSLALLPPRAVSQASISRFESGQTEPSVERFRALCEALGCSMEQVIGVAKKLSAESDLGDRDLLLDCLRKPEVRADGEVVSQIEKLLANAEASSEAMSVLGEIAATVSAGGSDSTLGRRLVQLAREGKVPSSALQPLAESLATMMVANEKRRNESRPRV